MTKITMTTITIATTPAMTQMISTVVDSPARLSGAIPSVGGGVGTGGRVVIPWTRMYSLHSDEANWGGSRTTWTVTRTRTYNMCIT